MHRERMEFNLTSMSDLSVVVTPLLLNLNVAGLVVAVSHSRACDRSGLSPLQGAPGCKAEPAQQAWSIDSPGMPPL